jgi:hypothetical protein
VPGLLRYATCLHGQQSRFWPWLRHDTQTPWHAAEMLDAPTATLEDHTDHLGEPEPAELNQEEEEQHRTRERFLADFKGDSMFLDDLAGEPAAPQLRAEDGGSGLISLGGSDDEGDVDINEHNLRQGGARNKFKPKGEATPTPVALGPEGAVPLRQVKLMQAGAAELTSAGELSDPWADLGLSQPEGPPPAQEAEASEEVDAFAAFDDLDPFAGFADLTPAAAEPGRLSQEALTAGSSVNPEPQPTDEESMLTSAAAGNPQPSADSAAAAEESVNPPEEQSPQQQLAPGPPDATRVPGFSEGVAAMFAGQWQQAGAYLGQAHGACRETGAGQLGCQVAQYAAAVGILESYAHVDEATAARLSRYAAALPLLMLDHISVLVNDAVGRNMRAGNYTWCLRQLQSFGEYCLALGRNDVAQGVAARLQQVQMTGNGNATVAEWESPAGLVSRVDSAASMQEIWAAVASVKAGML